MKILRQILHFLWGLPQNIVGGILYLIYKRKYPHAQHGDAYVCEWDNKYGSVSLGMFLFVTNADYPPLVMHEYGHTKQSMLLGPLYLLVIGLPSILWAGCFDKWRAKHHKSYYWFYTEKWADKWGGVVRR